MDMDGLSEKMHARMDSLPKATLKNLLIEAISEMQSYNGQTITSAICRAMRAEEVEGKKGVRWKLPSNEEIKKNFS